MFYLFKGEWCEKQSQQQNRIEYIKIYAQMENKWAKAFVIFSKNKKGKKYQMQIRCFLHVICLNLFYDDYILDFVTLVFP